jgi:hypothetical protein
MEIKPYELNVKDHPEDQLQAIANSIEAFGCKQPIVVDKNGVIVVGHGRFFAMRDILDYKEIKEAAKSNKGDNFMPYQYADDLTDKEIAAYRIADNKLNESEWNIINTKLAFEALPIELQQVTGLQLEDIEGLNLEAQGDEDELRDYLQGQEGKGVLKIFTTEEKVKVIKAKIAKYNKAFSCEDEGEALSVMIHGFEI